MNKPKIIITIIAMALIVLCMVFVDLKERLVFAKACDISNYEWEIENFPYDGNVGPVPDAKTAIVRAKELWLEKYGVINGNSYDPTHGLPVSVAYDAENDCWVVSGTLPKNTLGSVPFAIIQGDGTVLAMGMA